MNTIPGFDDCDNTDVVEWWFQCNKSPSIDHDTNVISASNNKLRHGYNNSNDISRHFEVFEAFKIELRR